MRKKHWISLAVLTAVILGAGHFLTGGDWYIVRVLKKAAPGLFTMSEDPVAQAQRQLTEAQKDVVEAKHQFTEARRAAAEAKRQLARTRRNEALSRRSLSGAAAKPEAEGAAMPDDLARLTGPETDDGDWGGETIKRVAPELRPDGGNVISAPPADDGDWGGEDIEDSISGPSEDDWDYGAEDIEPTQTARAGTASQSTARRVGNALAPVFQRPGVVWNRTGRAPLAPFQIITSPGADYFVKLAEAGTGREAVAVYVQGGTPVDVKIPLGAYTMRYAYGEKWYGEKHRFGPGELTRYSAAMRGNTHEILRFEDAGDRYLGNTVELIQQAGGNLPTKTISADQF